MIFSSSWKVILPFFFFGLAISIDASASTLIKEATWYSDSFDWGQTANGDIFDQKGYSAAICDIPLGQYLYVSKGNTGVVVDANDRPNCSKYPQVIDFSRDVFALFAPLSSGRISDMQVTDIWPTSTDLTKWFFPRDVFTHLDVTLISSIPTVLFAGQWIDIKGRVTKSSDYVIVYLSHENGSPTESSLVKVEKDGSFQTHVLLPKKIGKYTFVIARGKSFNTDKYATIALIDEDTLSYPSLPTEKYKITPRIGINGAYPNIPLPENIFAQMTLKQWTQIYQTTGNSLIFRDTGLSPGVAQVQIGGYMLSTSSPLDRRSRVTTLFSGSVILDRTHESSGAEKAKISIKKNIANFRFTSPTDYKIRPNYYITLPNGDVKQYTFDQIFLSSDMYLKPGISVNASFPLPIEGSYILEIVRQDGIAYANIPLSKGKIWNILDPLTDLQIRTLRKNRNAIIASTFLDIGNIRSRVGKTPVVLDQTLSILAQAKVDDMISRNYRGHMDPDGRYIDWLAEDLGLGIDGSLWENIGYGTVSDLALQDGLGESWVHRYNMLESFWKKVGIGYGVKDGQVYLVHVFGE
jgi:rare lipoprotein A